MAAKTMVYQPISAPELQVATHENGLRPITVHQLWSPPQIKLGASTATASLFFPELGVAGTMLELQKKPKALWEARSDVGGESVGLANSVSRPQVSLFTQISPRRRASKALSPRNGTSKSSSNEKSPRSQKSPRTQGVIISNSQVIASYVI